METILYQRRYQISTAVYGGHTPIHPGRYVGAMNKVARRRLLEAMKGVIEGRMGAITESQIILKWLKQQGGIVITYACFTFSCRYHDV